MKELSMSERTALAGYLLVGDVDAAYRCTNQSSKANKAMFHKQALRWLRDERCVKFLNEQKLLLSEQAKKEYHERKESDPNYKDLTDKSNVIQELQVLYQTEQNPKIKSDILMKVADLQRMRNETPKDEEERVLFYLPLKECEGCPYSTRKED